MHEAEGDREEGDGHQAAAAPQQARVDVAAHAVGAQKCFSEGGCRRSR